MRVLFVVRFRFGNLIVRFRRLRHCVSRKHLPERLCSFVWWGIAANLNDVSIVSNVSKGAWRAKRARDRRNGPCSGVSPLVRVSSA